MLEHRLLRNELEKHQAEMLLARCDLADGSVHPVYIPNPGQTPDGGIPPLFWTENDSMLGLLLLEGWPIPEGCPIVHPDHRRRGIGQALVRAATDVCRARGGRRWLMAADSLSNSAASFADHSRAKYDSSEYRMDLNMDILPERPTHPDGFTLQVVGQDELEVFAQTLAEAFDDPLDQVRRWTSEQFQLPNIRLYVAILGRVPVATARLIAVGFEAYITAIGVIPSHRRQGLGRLIVLTSVHALLDEGWNSIRIEVDTTNEPAYRLYRSCGFRESRTYRFYELLTSL